MNSKQNSFKKIAFLFASWFGTGYSPVASGTIGSLAALPLCWIVKEFTGFWGVFLAVLVLFGTGYIATKKVLKYTEHDPSFVVIDEVLGQMTTFLFVAFVPSSWILFFLGFLLFRFFDIFKIWPACYFDEKINNAYGVMLDDLAAGLYAGGILYLFSVYFLI